MVRESEAMGVQVRAVDFVGVAVPDMQQGKVFYRDTLGLAPLYEGDGWAEYDTGNVALALYHDADAPSGAPSTRNAVVALAVPDIHAAVAELRGKGVAVVQEVEEYDPCYMATVTDPFGNAVMLHQRKDGTAG